MVLGAVEVARVEARQILHERVAEDVHSTGTEVVRVEGLPFPLSALRSERQRRREWLPSFPFVSISCCSRRAV